MKKIILTALAFCSLIPLSAIADKRATVGTTPSEEKTSSTKSERIAADDHPLAGEWIFYIIDGKRVTGEDRPYIAFDFAEKRLYGSNGCNIIGADVIFGKHNSIKFSDILSTRMYCPDAPYERSINVTLPQISSYKISRFGHEYYLDLMNGRGHTVLVLRQHNMEFLNGIWNVERIDGEKNENPEIKIAIDVEGSKIHGNTGCNIFNGELYIDPDKTSSMQFLNIATTRRACPDSTSESAFLAALEETESAFGKSDDEISLVDKKGREVLLLRRAVQ